MRTMFGIFNAGRHDKHFLKILHKCGSECGVAAWQYAECYWQQCASCVPSASTGTQKYTPTRKHQQSHKTFKLYGYHRLRIQGELARTSHDTRFHIQSNGFRHRFKIACSPSHALFLSLGLTSSSVLFTHSQKN